MAGDATARVLIVADDLTGALDTAGAFAEQGVATKVVALPLESDPESVREARVVAVNTASRHLPPAQAAARVHECVRQFAGQHFDVVYKKIDSTLRGNVVVETLALMDACDRRLALVAPAFPAQGRTMLNGIVHVEGVPLAQTGFAEDALSPPPLQPLGEVFGAVVGQAHVRAWRHGEVLPRQDVGVVIADAGSDEELAEVFNMAVGQAGQTLLVGSAGLGVILARCLEGANREGAALKPASDPIVFVVGSRAARSHEQVAQLGHVSHTVVIEAPNGIAAGTSDALGSKQVVLVTAEDPEADIADAVEVAQRLAQTGLEIAADIGAGTIVVTGGDTAIALLEASRCPVIDVRGNLMPGIPYSSFQWQGRPMYLVTKAGGFGTRDTMADIVRCLRAGAASGSQKQA